MHKRNTKKHQLPTANATTNEPKTIAAATNLGSKSQNNSIINRDKTMRKAQAPQASTPTETPHQNLWPASNKNKTNSSRPTTKHDKTNPTMKRLQYNQTNEARERKDWKGTNIIRLKTQQCTKRDQSPFAWNQNSSNSPATSAAKTKNRASNSNPLAHNLLAQN